MELGWSSFLDMGFVTSGLMGEVTDECLLMRSWTSSTGCELNANGELELQRLI